MKKLLSTILVFSLCVTLCACSGVSREDYDAAVANYNALAANYEALKNKVEPYADVIDALEAEDYDRAVKAVTARKPVPEVTKIRITKDNLWDYFEIAEDRQERTDAYGNTVYVCIYKGLALKEGCVMADPEEYPTDVAAGFAYDSIWNIYYYPCTVDFETFSCDRYAATTKKDHYSFMVHFPADDLSWTDADAFFYNESAKCESDQTNVKYWETADVNTVENFEILDVSGVLYLAGR